MKKSAFARRLGLVASDPLRILGLQTILAESCQAEVLPLSVLDVFDDEGLDAIIIGGVGTDRIFDLLAMFHRSEPQIRIIVIGLDEDHEYIRKVIAAGAKGYLPQTATVDEICCAIETVLDGSIWAPRKVLSQLVETPGGALPCPQPKLTVRQIEVLRLLANGQPNREIATTLGIEEKTVKSHVGRLMRKMGVDNRIALTLLAISQNLVVTPPPKDK